MKSIEIPHKCLSSQDLIIIKSLVALVEGIIIFLKSENKIIQEVIEEFSYSKNKLTRLLGSVEYHLPRYISKGQIKSLMKIIQIGNDLIKFGQQQCSFLSNDILAINFFNLVSKLKENAVV